MKNIFSIIFFLLITGRVFAQGHRSYSDHQKGQFYIFWGWNLESFTKSNINFKGADYNFKLYHVVAHDRPTGFQDLHKFLSFHKLTNPQTNFRMGYFVTNSQSVTFGIDHMKYVMDQDQTVHMKGTISQNGPFKGNYDGPKVMTTDFMKFEHTDGLNYINVETEKYFTLYHTKDNLLMLSGMIGGGTGILFPRTNVTMLNYARNDRYHVSGFGWDVKAAVQATFLKHLLIRVENKYGYIDMPNIILHKKGIPGRAKQAFFFTELDGVVGATFSLARTKKHS
jgi:hypothetical protein